MPEQIIHEAENHWMFFIKNIHIGALEMIITTRIDISAFEDILPSYLLGVISALGNVILHITDYKLKFATSLYSDVFTDVFSLSNTLYNTYYRQLIFGLFKIVGSLDILGNPTGYASSIADGFMQIIEAPRKGLINGPLGFGEGIAKGFGSFVSTVLSSSFDVVGKISGTLLASCEMLQGEKVFEELEEREPEHLLDGLYMGLKEGVKDLGKGLGGIFYKPYQGAKKEGVKGFFKGLGSGVLGAVVSPFTALFRVTNNVFVGLKNTVNMFNPKLKTDRFRYPRTIEKAEGLKPYDEDKATIKAILDFLKEYEGQEIVFFRQFKYFAPGLNNNSDSYLILTSKCVIVVYEAKEVVFKLLVDEIKSVEVHREENRTNFDIIFNLIDNSREYIKTKEVNVCTDFYLMFESSKK
jgi:vacuolar protein sorting-associated protein 13A/C